MRRWLVDARRVPGYMVASMEFAIIELCESASLDPAAECAMLGDACRNVQLKRMVEGVGEFARGR